MNATGLNIIKTGLYDGGHLLHHLQYGIIMIMTITGSRDF